jgi:hypothetical protein
MIRRAARHAALRETDMKPKVYVQLANQDGTPLVSVPAQRSERGLAITPAFQWMGAHFTLRKGEWCVTHIASGARLNPGERGMNLKLAQIVFDHFIALPIDWTLGRAEVVRKAKRHMGKIRGIRDLSRGLPFATKAEARIYS